ncbi:DUF806 family protein [Weissella cibaria]|uniref:DUF806 family protein n=1 Tax=Weissella cibaria TaxID=137591 RepID=UPI001E61E42E|nr:DUF806 family protein [Weissella cibaria]MCC6123147.1 DUF806 family protein [Weissella cibaria]MCT0953888.1 DUF806 family protein [Weissella cibaria]
MRPVDEVVGIIADIFPDWQVYLDSIPPEVIDDKNVTQVLITESVSDVGNYADDTFNMIELGVRIQIFYSLDFDRSMLVTEVQLMKELEKEHWRVTDSQPHYLDLSQTDEQQTIKNIEVNKTTTLVEIGYDG